MKKRERKPAKIQQENDEKELNMPTEVLVQKKRKRRDFHGRQQSASIYFLVLTFFSLISFLIVILFGITQQIVIMRSFRNEAAREISEKGGTIKEALLKGPPEALGSNNYSGYLRFLAATYDVNIIIMDEDGRLLFPVESQILPDSPEYEEYYNRSAQVALLLEQLAENGTDSAVYEGDGEYVYGAKIVLFESSTMYLHVGKSLQLMENARHDMIVRTVLLSVFVLILAFALSSAVAGWLVNPVREITEKAHLLAQGDFAVDFHGTDYGREMVELADTLNFARDELSKTDRMQKELIANISHDFKTPLTMIKAYASMIIEISGDNPEKRNKHAQVIVEEADRLASLVGDVLDLSKIHAGISQLDITEYDMSASLQGILDRFAYLKDTQGYSFEVEMDEALYTTADERKIEQVLYNLIGNAVNYTGEDKKVYVKLKKETDTTFRFSVTDTGAGIKPEELGEIWERYYRSAEMHKRPVKGTGLGLSIVKTIAQRHGFVYGVDSKEGEGSTFYVVFPLTDSKEKDKNG